MLEARFWSQVSVHSPGRCWPWRGAMKENGYGTFGYAEGDMRYAHRVAYELFHGLIAEGMVIDHLCRNRDCVNPDHLDQVPQSLNLLRGDNRWHKKHRTTCRAGHQFTAENTYLNSEGRRCLTCRMALEAG